MNNFVRYEPIEQEPFFCVPACLQMILKRNLRDIKFSQKEIISYLNYKIEDKSCHVTNLNDQFFILNRDVAEQSILNVPADIGSKDKKAFGKDNTRKRLAVIAKVIYNKMNNG